MHLKRDKFDSLVGVMFFAAILLAIGLTATKLTGRVDVHPARITLL